MDSENDIKDFFVKTNILKDNNLFFQAQKITPLMNLTRAKAGAKLVEYNKVPETIFLLIKGDVSIKCKWFQEPEFGLEKTHSNMIDWGNYKDKVIYKLQKGALVGASSLFYPDFT